jgi:hypothetical protein
MNPWVPERMSGVGEPYLLENVDCPRAEVDQVLMRALRHIGLMQTEVSNNRSIWRWKIDEVIQRTVFLLNRKTPSRRCSPARARG